MINYDSPAFASVVLYVIYALLLLVTGLTVWSVLRSVRMQGECEDEPLRGFSQRKLALATAALLVITMTVTWLSSGTSPISVNGKTYDDVFWLRTSNMLILTPIVLMAVILVLMGVAEIVRRRNNV